MPVICTFRGIKFYIYWDDHNPPHFHAVYGGQSMQVRIDNAEPIEGDLPPKQRKLVLAWAVLRREELLENWELASQSEEPYPINPLI